MSTTVINTTVSESRSVPRIWIEGARLAHAGIEIGVRYVLNVSQQLRRIELRPAAQDFEGKTVNVSKRTRNDRIYPLIELRDAAIQQLFEVGTKIRVAIQKGRIIISLSHVAQKVKERVERFNAKMKTGQPLETVSLFHGAGLLDSAMHEGFKRSSISSYVKVAVEIEGDYLDASLTNSRELWREDSIAINADIRDVNIGGQGIPQADVLIAGIPCLGASRAGASCLGLQNPEEHKSAGTLFNDVLDWVKAINPAIIVIENVVEYLASTGMTVIRSVLTHLGYQISEGIIDGAALGSLENRKRMCMVATTPGACDPVDFEQLTPVRKKESKIADILEDIPADSDRWKAYEYLSAKEVRDKANGKGFGRQLLTGEESSCWVVGRGYAKARSSESYVIAPHDPSLTRLFTPAEHARVKTVPEEKIQGLSATIAHQCLGQGIIYCAFVAVGQLIAKTILGLIPSALKAKPVKPEVAAEEFALTA